MISRYQPDGKDFSDARQKAVFNPTLRGGNTQSRAGRGGECARQRGAAEEALGAKSSCGDRLLLSDLPDVKMDDRRRNR